MSKRRRIIAATELRVHLGDALKALDEEDIVVQKGGVPIAMLVRYGPEAKVMTDIATTYERALSKRAEPGGWERTLGAMERGWAAINTEEMTAEVYRWRDAGTSHVHYDLDADEESEEPTDGGEVPGRQRRLHQGHGQRTRVADERVEYDASGRPRD